MSVWNGLRRLLSRAREEATDAAQAAKIRLDIRSLEGRRENLFRDIGRKVYEARNDNTEFSGIEPICKEIDAVAAKIRERQDDLEAVRSRPHTSRSATVEAEAPSV
jgi:hypothetical protein